MNKLERLYEAFGDLLYIVAMADGIIQKEEIEALEKITKNHSWAKEINWAFNYDRAHGESVEFLYKKVLNICHEFGPNPEYKFLIEVLEQLANASNGIDESEQQIINKFTAELTERFKTDLDKADFIEKLKSNKID